MGENGILMGQFCEAAYPTTEIEMHPGDRLVLYTDGIIEAADASGEMFGSERLLALLAQQAERTAEAFATHLMDTLRAWTGRTDAFADDVSLVVLDRLETPSAGWGFASRTRVSAPRRGAPLQLFEPVEHDVDRQRSVSQRRDAPFPRSCRHGQG